MRKAAAGALLGLGAGAIVLALGLAGAFEDLELILYDRRVRLAADPGSVHPDIALVLIDDQTIRDLEPALGRWPWPRMAHSLLIGFINRAPARVIAVDIGFWERDTSTRNIAGDTWTGQESDEALVAAVREVGNVVLLADAVYAGGDDQQNRPPAWKDPGYRLGGDVERRPMLLAPFEPLGTAGSVAHNFLPVDADGPARRMPPFVRVGERDVPSLGMAAALVALGVAPGEVRAEDRAIRVRDRRIALVTSRIPDTADPSKLRDQHTMLINYRAPADRPSYARYEARLLLKSEEQLQSGETPALDPAVFRDKIVFIGTSASGTHDVFQTPFGTANMPGIQLHASVTDSVLSNRFLRPASGWTRTAAVVIAAVAVGIVSVVFAYRTGVVAAFALAAAWTLFTIALFRRGVWVDLSQPLVAIGLSLFVSTAYRYFVEDREKRKVKQLFGRYVSRDVYEQLLEHPERAQLGGARRDMTVLFSDIRGFTTVTEKGQPEELVAQLNEYFSRMVEIVFRNRGTVDKFVGDMVMALFGAPLDDPDHAEHGVKAAVEMVHELGELNRRWAAEGRAVLDIGVGVNSGEMIAGNIGSSSIMSYTVIGDNVNLGSRLESLNKDYKTRIIISDATRERLKGRYEVRPLGDVVVKGKTRPVAIFEVCVPSPLPAPAEEAPL
ncbi:MAG TPA: adenylate/guanylate cyclase domain-containing protein [Vicinamibacterales bacterium]|nr:adenylate/guanylate cyclase domain-containing protein [Vicinamibacterales bacterium]